MANYQNFWLFQALDIYADTNSANAGLNIQINGLSPSGLDYNVSRKVLSTLDFRNGILPGGDIAVGLWYIYDNTPNILTDILLPNTSSMVIQDSEAFRFRGGYINIFPFWEKSDGSLGIGRFNLDFRTTAIPEISPYWTIFNPHNGVYNPLSNPTSDYITGIYKDNTEIGSFGYIFQNNTGLVNYNNTSLTTTFSLSASYLTRSQTKVITMFVIPKIILDVPDTTPNFLNYSSGLGNYTGPWVNWSLNAMTVNNPQTFVMNHVSMQRPQWETTTNRLIYQFNANPHPDFLPNGPGYLNTQGALAVFDTNFVPWEQSYLPPYGPAIPVSTSRVEILNTGLNYWAHNSVTGIPNIPYWNKSHPTGESMYGITGIWLNTGQTGIFQYNVFNGEDAVSGYYPSTTYNNAATLGPKLSQLMGWSKIVDFKTGPVLVEPGVLPIGYTVDSTFEASTGPGIWTFDNTYNIVNFTTPPFLSSPILNCDGVSLVGGQTVLMPYGLTGLTGYSGPDNFQGGQPQGAGIFTLNFSEYSVGEYVPTFSRLYSVTQLWNSRILVQNGINSGNIYVLNHENIRPWNSYDNFNFSPVSYFSNTGPLPLNDILWNQPILTPSVVTNNYDALRWEGWPPTYIYTDIYNNPTYTYYDYPQYSGNAQSITGNTFIYTPDIINTYNTGMTAPYMKELAGNNTVFGVVPMPITNPTGPLIFQLTGPSWSMTIPTMAHISGPQIGTPTLTTGSFFSSNPASWVGTTQKFYWDIPYQENFTDYGLSTYVSIGRSIESYWSLGPDTGMLGNPNRPFSGLIMYKGSPFLFGYAWEANDMPPYPSGTSNTEYAAQLIDIGNEQAIIKMNQYDLGYGTVGYYLLDASYIQYTFGSIPGISSYVLGNNLLDSTNWTSSGWTGSYTGGWLHTTGNTTSLTNTLAATMGIAYSVTINISGMSTGSINISFGGVTNMVNSNSNQYFNFVAISTGTLSITPTSGFDGLVFIDIQVATPIIQILPYNDSTVWDQYKANSILVSNNDQRVFTSNLPSGIFSNSGLQNMWGLIATQPTGIQFSTGNSFNDFIFSSNNFVRNDNLRIYTDALFSSNIGPTGITGGDYTITFQNVFNGSTSVRYSTSATQKFYSAPSFTEKVTGYNSVSYTGWSYSEKISTRVGWTQMDTNVYSITGGINNLPGVGNSYWDIDWVYYNNSLTLTGMHGVTTHSYTLVDTLDFNNYPVGGNVILDLPTGPSVLPGLYYAKMKPWLDISQETNYTGLTGVTTPKEFRVFGDPIVGNISSPLVTISFPSPGNGIGVFTCSLESIQNLCTSMSYDYTHGFDIDVEFNLYIDTYGYIGNPNYTVITPTVPTLSELNNDNTSSYPISIEIDMGKVASVHTSHSSGDYTYTFNTHSLYARLKIYSNRNTYTEKYNILDNPTYISSGFTYTDWINIGNFTPTIYYNY